VEAVCRKRGYGLNISLYNLSNVDAFVFPEKVGQRSVDGLILTAYVEAGVVMRFREFGIPCVCIGDNVEVAELIPTISADVAAGFFQAVEYAAGLGHRRILLYEAPTRRGREIKEKILGLAGQTPSLSACQLLFYTIPGCLGDYSAGKPLAKMWFSTPEAKRPTCVISSPQTTVALFGELNDRGVRCPRDISLISTGETGVCRYFSPRLTTFHFDHQEVSGFAVNLLLDHLEKGEPLTADMSKNDFPCVLTVRESCGPAPQSSEH
jgi:LacI family transcriptional regulator